MIDSGRHLPLRPLHWDADSAKGAIEEIVAEARTHFDSVRFWPAHPQDEQVDGNTSLYFGAAGVIWAIDYLQRMGAVAAQIDFRPVLPRLIEQTQAQFESLGEYSRHGSLLFGDLGTALVLMRLGPSTDVADLIYRRALANNDLPLRELMWGTAGSMLACLHMHDLTQEPRWRTLFEIQAGRLIGDLTETASGPLWTQDLYGSTVQYLGPVHGFAGNMIPLMHGWNWLSEPQRTRIAEAVSRTLSANAVRSERGVTWHPRIIRTEFPPPLCQHCHGAPGMVTAFADAPFTSPLLESLLVDAGHYTWVAGPLSKGSNLCHGTGGNAYAFLKLYRRTQDSLWLKRARAFAMNALAQYREALHQYGRGRFSLWTGDIGLAIFLHDCLRGTAYFPSVDVF